MKMNLKIYWLALFGLAFLCACSPQGPSIQTLELTGRTMGTTFTVKVVTAVDSVDAELLLADINNLLIEVNRQMSTYQPDSEISRFNQYTETAPFAVSPEFVDVVAEGLRLGAATQGAFDITVGPLVNLWGFGPDGRPNKVPTPKQIAEAKGRMGQDLLKTFPSALSKSNPNIYVDLSAIAKGYGVDKVATLLDERGFSRYMVEIGGELKLKGSNAHDIGWRIAIEKPDNAMRASQRIISPGDVGIATSGDYRNYFEEDGVRYTHIIDPITANPVEHKLASITVIHSSTMTADGLATALIVMGPEKAMKFAIENELAVLMLVYSDTGFIEQRSPKFDTILSQSVMPK